MKCSLRQRVADLEGYVTRLVGHLNRLGMEVLEEDLMEEVDFGRHDEAVVDDDDDDLLLRKKPEKGTNERLVIVSVPKPGKKKPYLYWQADDESHNLGRWVRIKGNATTYFNNETASEAIDEIKSNGMEQIGYKEPIARK